MYSMCEIKCKCDNLRHEALVRQPTDFEVITKSPAVRVEQINSQIAVYLSVYLPSTISVICIRVEQIDVDLLGIELYVSLVPYLSRPIGLTLLRVVSEV